MVMKSGNCKRSEIDRERYLLYFFLPQFLTYFKLRISLFQRMAVPQKIFLRRVADIWRWWPHFEKLSSVWPLAGLAK